MDFDYNLAKDIILVSIPVVGAVITTVLTTDAWQKNKERSEIKRKILLEFSESIGRTYTMLGEFDGQIYNSYLDVTTALDGKDGTPDLKLVFPENDDEKPFRKYNDKWQKFEKNFWDLIYLENNFIRSIRFYYRDDEIV